MRQYNKPARRFSVRFNNGVYHVFDDLTYTVIAALGLRKQAETRAADHNRGPR